MNVYEGDEIKLDFQMIGQLVLFVMFLISTFMKFTKSKSMVQHWNEYRYPMWFMTVIAALETIGAIGMLVAIWIPGVLKVFALLLAVLMLGAIHAHLFRARHKPYMAINALVMLGIAGVLLLG
ncbi:MAG: conserved hypothetical rane protein [Brevibacillus sp.]|nr:conserved hypothetical rane protein [Brevibacillus sp.]